MAQEAPPLFNFYFRYTWDQRTTISSAFAPGSVADAIASAIHALASRQ